eukprot:TRINITY_DN60653_c0_g1_i1.p1 TRINITY_DN60653_c0_g1~~TRINITY_DN60653_c0_g1_i1.p1  ORF type:complete len:129 (-),score=21.70 TRINITY_DN60653_c0_g1_i1:96-431(-)
MQNCYKREMARAPRTSPDSGLYMTPQFNTPASFPEASHIPLNDNWDGVPLKRRIMEPQRPSNLSHEFLEKQPLMGFKRQITETTDFQPKTCLLYTSPSPRDLSTSRMPSSA